MSRTDKADELINEQIEKELDKLDRITTSDDEKPKILQRVAELRKMLVDEPETVKEEPVAPGPYSTRPGERPSPVTPASERLRASQRPGQKEPESLLEHIADYAAKKINKFL